jgi:hypothetical protein
MRHLPKEAAIQRYQSFTYAHIQQNTFVEYLQVACPARIRHRVPATGGGLRPVVRRVVDPRPAGREVVAERQQDGEATSSRDE